MIKQSCISVKQSCEWCWNLGGDHTVLHLRDSVSMPENLSGVQSCLPALLCLCVWPQEGNRAGWFWNRPASWPLFLTAFIEHEAVKPELSFYISINACNSLFWNQSLTQILEITQTNKPWVIFTVTWTTLFYGPARVQLIHINPFY